MLVGSTTDTYITAVNGYKYYVLAQKEGVVGMYRAKLTDGHFLNNAHKEAYLPLYVGVTSASTMMRWTQRRREVS